MRLWLLISLFCASAMICMGCQKPSDSRINGISSQHEARSAIQVDSTTGMIIRRGGSGKVIWSTSLQGDLRSQWPLVTDNDRVYVSCGDGVTALDWETGKVLWSSVGLHDRLMLSGDLLLAADSRRATEISDRERWLVARKTSTGTVVFRVRLPLHDLIPRPIREISGLFLIQTDEQLGGKREAILVDREGKVRHRFDCQVIDGIRLEDDYVFLTDRNISRRDAQDGAVWTVSFPYRESRAGGGLLRLPGGDLIGFLFGEIADTGAQVMRLDLSTGNVSWHAQCKGLGVTHSEYDHRAEVTVQGNKVRVTSVGAAGTFVEILDLASGKQLEREIKK